MPIFEFVCKKCNNQFEKLVFLTDELVPICPKCKSKDVIKLISAGNFRAHGIPSGSGGFKAPSCAPTGG